MWILDSEGDFLDGKRVWLRPGKKYLFGRIKQDGVRHAISHTSISRKHMVIEVSPVQPGDGTHIYAKSKLFVSDEGSKVGTKVDGERIESGSKKLLTGDEHTIKLGKYQHELHIKWQPTVLSFSFSSKELKAKDPLARVRSRLEDLDIKTVIPYVPGQTTHVVQNKRNTAKGLQALVNGKYIVQDSYLDALVYAATPGDLENEESLSPLEADFDNSWPVASEYLPPPGKEPVQRSAEAFAPNPGRINVFDGYTFVFGDTAQYDNLQAPINNAHGKALLYPIENGVTTPEELAQYMRNAAGHKGLAGDREGPGGVVLVRFRAKGDYEQWSTELGNNAAQIIDQRPIEQSEFLDAILENDASHLCRTLPESSAPSQSTPAEASQPVPTSTSDSQPPSTSPPEAPSQPVKKAKGPRVRTFVSKVKTFDDGFDIASIPRYDPEEEATQPSPPAMDMDPIPEESQPQPSLEEEDEDVMSGLLPGAKAMKRRRADTVPRQKDTPAPKKEEVERKPKRQKLDVMEAARQRREAEDNARRQEEEAARQDSLKDMDIEKMKDLAIVEEMEVPARLAQSRASENNQENDRWDERWNGRKNFKKFRRKGDANQHRNRIQTVIVPLEEVTRKEFGIGEHYWVSSRKSPQPQSQQSPPSRAESRQESQRENIRERSLPVSQDEIPSSRSQSTGLRSQTPASRRQKRPREVQESDSEDELRFRFRRRR